MNHEEHNNNEACCNLIFALMMTFLSFVFIISASLSIISYQGSAISGISTITWVGSSVLAVTLGMCLIALKWLVTGLEKENSSAEDL